MHELAKFLLHTVEGKTSAHFTNCQHFVHILRHVKNELRVRLVSYDVESLQTNILVDKVLILLKKKRIEDECLMYIIDFP